MKEPTTHVSIRLPSQLIDDLKLLSGDGRYQALMKELLNISVRDEISRRCNTVRIENQILKDRIKDMEQRLAALNK